MTVDTTMLGMAGAATTGVLTASAFVIQVAIKIGRHMQRIDALHERVAFVDAKVDRHIEWHEEREAAE